ncbi:ABC transporter permease [Ruegeria sp. 2205SS24-7]|uniref:FtsX-like permease family protein n=1 Tax=Ruegeria discodermiae TaxID=3064389 RepID=UPI002741AF61|nr:FtsX-like permease family protein [Ruegeria sp. 2205SS24-7]MDP5215672.1 ABC transporter permease [Ruegeria sp. 2205SS24-7]
MLITWLALKDLWRERFYLFCNCALLVGILVPLLVLFGVKNGVYSALIGEMMENPAYLQIDTAGNVTLSEDDLAPLRGWTEIAFMTPKVRTQFDYMNVRQSSGRRIRQAVIVPSGTGDPTLPDGARLDNSNVAVSALLARQLELAPGASVQLISQAEGRPRQLVLDMRVGLVLEDRALGGRAVLVPFETLDLIEAFYDAYALPDHGIDAGKDIAGRVPAYSGARIYARDLEGLPGLQTRIEDQLGVTTHARTADVTSLLELGRNLTLALSLTAAIATLGLAAALTLSFWSEVARKRRVLARLAMLGLTRRQLALFPVVQALVAAALGLLLSFLLYGIAGRMAQHWFGQGLPGGRSLSVISMGQAVMISLAVIIVVALAAAIAAWRAQRSDPALVLREVS